MRYWRRLIVALAVLFNMVLMAGAGDADIRETRLSERILIMHHAPWDETMTVVDAGPSLIVVDTWGSLNAAREAKVRMERVFHKPVSHVVNTHHHWDHTFGNAAFPEATIVGHRFCAEDMMADYAGAAKRKQYFKKSSSGASNESWRKYIADVGKETSKDEFRLFFPNRLVDMRDTFQVGDLTVFLYHTPGIHTRSNLTIFIPELGIVFGRREFSDPAGLALEAGADPAIIANVLQVIIASGKRVRFLIPGHGNPIENPNLNAGVEKLKAMNKQ